MGCVSSSNKQQGEFFNAYKVGSKLGEGAYGQVRTATLIQTGEELAVKIIDVRQRDAKGEVTQKVDLEMTRMTRAECVLWEQVGNNVHCVQLLKTFFEASLCYLVMEKCHGGSIMDKLVSSHTLDKAELARVFREMLLGIAHCHQAGVVHRDVKPDNFLFGGADRMTVKLCDFGLAIALPLNKGLQTEVKGTAPYMSPEMLSECGYDHRTDMWSLGATTHLMLFGSFPYTPPQETAEAMKQAIIADHPKLNISGDDSIAVFIKTLLQRSPKQRSTAVQALDLPFVRHGTVAPGLLSTRPLRKARRLNEKFNEDFFDPTVQRSIDELLRTLALQKSLGGAKHFSERYGQTEQPVKQVDDDDADNRIRKRTPQRRRSHSGVVGEGGDGGWSRQTSTFTDATDFSRQTTALDPQDPLHDFPPLQEDHCLNLKTLQHLGPSVEPQMREMRGLQTQQRDGPLSLEALHVALAKGC